MKRYRMIVQFSYCAVVEFEAESKEDFKSKVDSMFNDDICGADMIATNDLEFDQYGEVEEVEE